MYSVKFPESNVQLGKNQPQYKLLHAYHGVIGESDGHTGFICKYRLTEYEISEIVKNKHIWLMQLTFGRNFNPIKLDTSINVFDTSNIFGEIHETHSVANTVVTSKSFKMTLWQRIKFLFTNKCHLKLNISHTGYDVNIKDIVLTNLKNN